MDELEVALFRHHLPVVVAAGAGLFEAAGVRPAFTVVRSSGHQRELVESGAADLAHTAVDNVAAWHGEAPWAVLRVVDLGLPHRLVARPPYAALADLDGARVAVDSALSGFVTLLRAVLERECPNATVHLVEVGALQRRLQALREGTVDACLLGAEQLALALTDGARVLLALNDHFPEYPGLAVSGLPPHVAARAEVYGRYAGALDAAAAWCFEPDGADDAVRAVTSVLGLGGAQAETWYRAELLRRTGPVPAGGTGRILAAAWRASGRLDPGQAPPPAWFRPDVLPSSSADAAAAIRDASSS